MLRHFATEEKKSIVLQDLHVVLQLVKPNFISTQAVTPWPPFT
eukprot:COSAG02_NODE_38159_length_432_cov_1.225225_1_plen_42_part_01